MLTKEDLEQLQLILMHDKTLYSKVLALCDKHAELQKEYDKLCVDYDDAIEELQMYEKEEYEELEDD